LTPKITVVTPSYNQAKYLEETLRSVLSQRDQIHEYFVLDGGSNDGSAELIKRYAEQAGGGIDYWHSQKDKGQSDAIHQGFQRATGDYIAWLNSDDVYLPGALRRVREALERNPTWDVLTGYHVRMDGDSRVISQHRIPGESRAMLRWGVHHTAQQTCFFRKSLYDKVGGLDLKLHCAMDTELWIRMLDAGSTWGHLPHYLAGFRQHETAKGSAWQKIYAEERVVVHGRWPQYLETPRRHIGLPFYRLAQMLSLRHPRAWWETRKNRGRKLSEVFGEWGPPVAPSGGATPASSSAAPGATAAASTSSSSTVSVPA
jgi:glycosyltransferase involved in cell wall biosynthesis